ncbi:MAG: YbhB/YbcL family Raf kinase inhibitor-like protein [Deltaproteobacteria bacterium]|nr:YbhB/YbcL family Raf kinase inhibitor-like protein [Deltaproteobacteria bacterium]
MTPFRILRTLSLALILALAGSASGFAQKVPLAEPNKAPETLKVTLDVKGGKVPMESVFNGFGCTGGNQSIGISWTGVPKEAKSIAILMHDPDAPTGVGFFHWSVVDLPADTKGLAKGASPKSLPPGAIEGYTDFGSHGYGGPCPPPGKPHRYIFTVYAVKEAKLGVDASATGALLRFMLNGNSLALGRATATFGR